MDLTDATTEDLLTEVEGRFDTFLLVGKATLRVGDPEPAVVTYRIYGDHHACLGLAVHLERIVGAKLSARTRDATPGRRPPPKGASP